MNKQLLRLLSKAKKNYLDISNLKILFGNRTQIDTFGIVGNEDGSIKISFYAGNPWEDTDYWEELIPTQNELDEITNRILTTYNK